MKAKKAVNEKVQLNSKKNARSISLAVHMGILLIALLPFSQSTIGIEQISNPTVEIVFTNTDISSGSSSTAPIKVNSKSELLMDRTKVTTKSVPELPSSAPVLESVESPVIIETQSDATEVIIEAEESILIEEDISSEDDSKIDSDEESNENTSSETDGEGEEGEHLDGKTLGDMDFDGEGVFGRKVIFHADVAGIAERNGRVVVNLCINRSGLVSHVAFNEEASTIKDSDYIRKALNVASDYIFESDFSAPSTQCGKLTFIFDLK